MDRSNSPPAPSGEEAAVRAQTVFGDFLCAACARAVVAVRPPLCTCCGKMFAARVGPDHLCEECIRHPWYFRRARSAGVFDQSLAILIHRFKYSSRIALAKPLGKLMRTVLIDCWPGRDLDGVVPVPLHPGRLRTRGFNQSLLLARTCCAAPARHPVRWPGLPVESALLKRTRRTASQTGLGRRERMANLKNAFALSPGKDVARRRLLLIDDVFTTGATVNECARVLLAAGAARVDVLTLTRTKSYV